MTVADIRLFMRRELEPIFGAAETQAMIRIIFHSLKGWTATDIIVHEGDDLSSYMEDKIRDITTRLKKQEPIQYILGEAYFYGMFLKVRPGVLIPRPETEQLVDLIIKENPEADLNVLDLCTGSGAIAIALARNLKFPSVTAIDISDEALAVTKENAETLKAGINLLHQDIFSYTPKPDSFDIIVSNPPYIAEEEKKEMEQNVLDYEPHIALFVSDAEPLVFYSRIAEIAEKSLKPGGKIYLEINPRFADSMRQLFEKAGYSDVSIINDSFGKKRFLFARKR